MKSCKNFLGQKILKGGYCHELIYDIMRMVNRVSDEQNQLIRQTDR